jgi:hypothetical protein
VEVTIESMHVANTTDSGADDDGEFEISALIEIRSGPWCSPAARAGAVQLPTAGSTLRQMLYAVAALLCVGDTSLSITVIVLLEVNSVVAQPIGPLNRF